MNWRYPNASCEPECSTYPDGFSDPFDGSTGLAGERRVYVLVKIITEVATLTTRGYDYQESQCGTEPRGKPAHKPPRQPVIDIFLAAGR